MDFNTFMAQAPDVKPRWVLVEGDVATAPESSTFGWSASQISSFESCPRAWYFDKIEKRPRVEKLATYFGSRFHEFREEYFYTSKMPDENNLCADKTRKVADELVQLKLAKTGDPVAEATNLLKDAAKLSKMGLVHLPMPNMIQNENVERSIDVTTSVGMVRGYVDFFLPDQGAVGYWPREVQWQPTNGVPLVGDHKTTSSKDYIKTLDELMNTDPQPALYGKAALEWTGAPVVDFLWHYNVKKGRKEAVPVRFRMSADQVLDRFAQVENTAKKMLDVFENAPSINPSDVTPNPKACDNYGGCPHRDYCPLTNEEKIGAIMNMNGNGGNNNFEAEMMAMAAQNNSNSNPALQAAQQSMQPNFGQPPQNPQAIFGQPPQQQWQQAAPAMNPQMMQSMPQGQMPQQAQQPQTLASMGQQMQTQTQTQVPQPAAVNPPDAAAPDLDATVESLKEKEKAEKPKKAKKKTKAEQELRAEAALRILLATYVANGDFEQQAQDAVAKADIFLSKL